MSEIRRNEILESGKSSLMNGRPSFRLSHRAFRAVWIVVWILAAYWTPPPFNLWRILLLKIFGAKVHWTARVYGTSRIWFPPNLTMEERAVLGPGVICYCMGSIVIKRRAVVSQRTHLCGGTHSISDPHFQLIAKPIEIGERAWVAAEAFIGPGVSVGEGAVVAARSAVFASIKPWCIYRGNPATYIGERKLNE